MKKQINEKYSKSSEDSSPSSSVVDDKLPKRIQAVIDGYLSIDKRHRPSDIKVFIDDKSGEIRWSCPCNPHRKGPYEWQGVDKMRRHTSGKQHSEYTKTRKAPKPAKRKPVNESVLKAKTEEARLRYISINPKNHREDDIKVFYDPEKEIFKWSCLCVKHKSGYALKGLQHMKIHTSSVPHTDFVEARVVIDDGYNLINKFEKVFGDKDKSFDPVTWWKSQGLLIDMLDIHKDEDDDEDARCKYCRSFIGYTNEKEEFERHVKGGVHRARVNTYHRQKGLATGYYPGTRKRERSPEPEVKTVIPTTKPKDAAAKTKKPIDPAIIEISEDLPKPSAPIKPKKRERSPSPPAEKDDKERERELKRGLIDRIYKRAYEYVDSKNIEAEIEERSKKMVTKILDEVFE